MVVKTKMRYVCQACGSETSKWVGQCADCQAWNTMVAEEVSLSNRPVVGHYAGNVENVICALEDVTISAQSRRSTGLKELDHVLGGGLVDGSVVLIGGDPGVGKSTLLLQCMSALSQDAPVLYVSGEESLQQIAMRAKRLGVKTKGLNLLAQTQVEMILALAAKHKPKVMVIDSVQTIYCDHIQSAPGSVTQVRESSARLVRYAKETGTAILIVGHVTKDGALAGPRVLEHMVDAVLYFEGQTDSRFRVVRAIKNRFGAVNELGVFAMTDNGLREVSNPSAIFLSAQDGNKSGSVVMVTWEGSRALMVEVQALVADSYLENPRRLAVGLEQNRLAMLLAVLSKHGGVSVGQQDVFVNVVGGMRVTETGSDLALILAVLSSFKDRSVPREWVMFGEIGLSGEVRPVQSGQERLKEAAKQGFKKAIVAKANAPKQRSPKEALGELEVIGIGHIREAIALI